MSRATRIFLIRHGETDWNVSRKVMGRLPIPLNDRGRGQVAALGRELAAVSIDACFHSPLLRTEETARAICSPRTSTTPAAAHEALAEVDYGQWEGSDFAALLDHPQYLAYYEAPSTAEIPGGESLRAVEERVFAFVESLRKTHAGQTVALVSHSDVIKIAVSRYLGLHLNRIHRLRIDNASLSYLVLSESGDRVVCVNRTGNLEHLIAR